MLHRQALFLTVACPGRYVPPTEDARHRNSSLALQNLSLPIRKYTALEQRGPRPSHDLDPPGLASSGQMSASPATNNCCVTCQKHVQRQASFSGMTRTQMLTESCQARPRTVDVRVEDGNCFSMRNS